MYGRTVNDNDFYPRPPRGGRLRPVHGSCKNHKNFYPRPPRGGRRFFASVNLQVQIISIHALREEGDPSASRSMACSSVFLSTPSARRATLRGHPDGSRSRNFYPRPPRGGRRTTTRSFRRTFNFYPRPPRGGRQRRAVNVTISDVFLSTPSARRAT